MMRPAESSGYSRLRSSWARSKGGKLGEDVGLLFLVEVLDDIDGLVGIELLQRLGHLLGGHDLEHLVAHRLVELGQAPRASKSVAERGDEDAALLGAEQLDQIGEVGLMQRKRQARAALAASPSSSAAATACRKSGADSALFVAQFDLACGVLHGLSDRQS